MGKKAKAAPLPKNDMTMTTSEKILPLKPFSAGAPSGVGSVPEMYDIFEREFCAEKTVAQSQKNRRPRSSRLTLDMPDEEILRMWNTPVRRSSIILGFDTHHRALPPGKKNS